MRYIALLRGINVGGQKRMKMDALKNAFQEMSFKNVKTYVQSGNVIFDYEPRAIRNLSSEIEEKINETFGFSVKVVVRSEDELISIINNNPYIKEDNIELDKLHVTLFLDIPDSGRVSSLDIKKEENEKFLINSQEVYIYCPNGYGNTKLNNAMFERKLKVAATTRNWKTMNNLLEMSKMIGKV